MVRPRWTLQLDLRQLRRLLRLRLAHLFWDSKPRQMFLCRRLEVLFLGGQDDTPCPSRARAATKALPTNPVAPVTKIFIFSFEKPQISVSYRSDYSYDAITDHG